MLNNRDKSGEASCVHVADSWEGLLAIWTPFLAGLLPVFPAQPRANLEAQFQRL